MYIVLLVIIILIIAYNLKYNKIEGYDARYTDITIDDCAKFCKTRAGCFGFAFDAKNKICYPAKNILTGPSYNSIHEKEFSENNVQCNKFKTILEPSDGLSFGQLKSNATFACSERFGLQPQLYLHDRNKLNNIDDGQNPDFILEIDDYRVIPYRWPTNQYDADQLDLLRHDREQQIFTTRTVTMMDRIRNAQPDPVPEEEMIIKEKPKTLPEQIVDNIGTYQKVIGVDLNQMLEDGLTNGPLNNQNGMQIEGFTENNLIHDQFKQDDTSRGLYGTNAFKDMKSKGFYGTNTYKAPLGMDKVFEIYDEFNQGIFLRNHKCVQDISFKGCLNYCSENKNCIGVEYNPQFFNHKNVCCPYKTLDVLKKRDKMHEHGKFFKKIRPKYLNKENIHLII
jgi:hypothetical protein